MKKNLIPGFIQEHINNDFGTSDAYVISCDICNFTPLLEQLLSEGKTGAEKTGYILNQTFGEITDIVYTNNGFITNFAGDAFTAVFRFTDSIEQIIEIGSNIIQTFKRFNENTENKLHIRLGIAKGDIQWEIISSIFKTYYFKGSGIRDAIKIQQHAKPDTVCLDTQILPQLKKSLIPYKKMNNILTVDLNITKKNKKAKTKIPSSKFNKDFFPDILSELSIKGEFRKTVPLFFNFSNDIERNELNRLITSIMEYSIEMNGYFNKVDFTEKGGIILVIFGAPFASENMIENALNMAVKIGDEFKHLNISAGIDYGISYTGFIGSKNWMEYTVLGDIVNTASRISCLSKGKIYISERVKQESRTFEFAFENYFNVKGKKKKISLYSIESKKNRVIDFASPFVSRENEQNRIITYIENTFKKSKSPIIYIEGESGIGKTRIVYHTLQNSKILFHYGLCDSVLFEPMSPIKQVIASIMDFGYYDDRDRKKSKADKYLASHFSEQYETYSKYIHHFFSLADEGILKHISGKEMQETTFYIIRQILIKECSLRRQIFVFDDMMWADEETIDFLNYAFQDNILNAGLIIVFREKNRVTDRIRLKHISIPLNNFNFKGVKLFITAFFEKKPSDTLLQLLWEKSEGNPLFLEQITIHLANNDLIEHNGNSINLSKADYELPSSIDRLIVSRLDSLSAVTREGIKKASVFGKEFEIILLNLLVGKNIGKILTEGERNKIISVISKNLGVFRHTLLHEIAYKMQFEDELKKLHSRIASLYEKQYSNDLSPYYEILYYHYKQANIKNKKMHYLKLAIERYMSTYSNEIAIKLIYELLKLDISKSQQAHAYINLGNIMLHTANYDEGVKVLQKAIRLCKRNILLCANAYKTLGEIYWSLGKYKKAIVQYNSSFNLYKKKNDIEGMSKIYELMGLVYYNKGDFNEAIIQFNNALKYAEKNRKLRNSIFSNMGLVLYRQGDDQRAMKYYQRALKDAEKSNDLNSQAKLHLRIGLIYRNSESFKQSIHHNSISLRINRKIGNRRSEAIVLGNMGQVYNDMGEKDRVLEYYFKALEIDKDVNNLENETIVLGNIANFYATEGQYAKSLKYYKDALIIDRQIGNKWSEAIDLGNMAELYKLQRKNSEADKYFAKCISIIRKMNARFPLSHFLSKRAELKMIMNEFGSAIKFANEALTIAHDIDKKNIITFCDSILEQINSKMELK